LSFFQSQEGLQVQLGQSQSCILLFETLSVQ
jgi:hypothetical protein